MSSSIVYPNIDNLIIYNNEYIKPDIDIDNYYYYYILKDTNNKYILNNNNILNKDFEMEVFAVGGGGAGGLYNGNGGSGGMIIYKKIIVKSNDILELNIGKGAYYIDDINNLIEGIQLKIYDGNINDIFDEKKNNIMNMKNDDLIMIGLKKILEEKISNINELNNIIKNNLLFDNVDILNKNISLNLFKYGYTIEFNTILFIPFDSSIEIELYSISDCILFFYTEEDIKNNNFSDDLSKYKKYNNNYYLIINNKEKKYYIKKTFKRNDLKKNEKCYIKIIYTDNNPLNFKDDKILKINFILLNYNNLKYIINNDKYFKFNNFINNYSINYSTPTTIYNNKLYEYIIYALGGNLGNINIEKVNYGNGGCISYNINNKNIKTCINDINGLNGLKLPKTFLTNTILDTYYYGSSGGGAFWKSNDNGGKGGENAGNGMSYTNITSISKPTNNTGCGGGGNSFLNILNDNKNILDKLSGSDGIIILKILKKKEDILIQSFIDINNKNNNYKDDIIKKINSNIELLLYNNNINNPENLKKIINLNNKELLNYEIIITDLYIFFNSLINTIKEYSIINENDRIKYPIKFIYNKNKKLVFYENNYYILNLYNNNINYYFNNITNSKNNITLNKFFSIIYKNEIIYDSKFVNEINFNNLNNNNIIINYIKKTINNLLNPNNILLFIENTYNNYFFYFKILNNYYLYNSINDYIIKKNITKTISINKIKNIINDIIYFNNNFFKINNNNINNNDIQIKNKNFYIYKQLKYNDINNYNLNKLNDSDNITNYSINKFKTYYEINKKNNLYVNIIYFFTIFLLIFIYIYLHLNNLLSPFIILILIIVLIIIIILLYNNYYYYNYNNYIFIEKFDCKNVINNNIICIDNKGNLINENNNKLPYYIISNTNNYIKLQPINNLIVDIFVYGKPLIIKDNNNFKYYEPNIDIYKNILLPKTSIYHINNNKIIISNNTNNDILINERNRTSINTNNTLNIYDCKGLRKDICNNINKIILNNKYSIYNNKGILLDTIKSINNNILINNFDFSPDINNIYYNYNINNINKKVLKEPFIIIKIKNNYDNNYEDYNNIIEEYKKEINNFNINVKIFLLNKNTKKIINYVDNYEIENNKETKKIIDYNRYIYLKNQQAYNILNLNIMTNFYLKILFCIIFIIYLFCILFYYYYNNFINILIFGLISSLIFIFIILYMILRHQRIESNKFYFRKPDLYIQ